MGTWSTFYSDALNINYGCQYRTLFKFKIENLLLPLGFVTAERISMKFGVYSYFSSWNII